jgi:hypothetical protein
VLLTLDGEVSGVDVDTLLTEIVARWREHREHAA